MFDKDIITINNQYLFFCGKFMYCPDWLKLIN